MRNRAKSAEAKQTNAGWWLPVEQLTLPMIEGIARSNGVDPLWWTVFGEK